MRTAEGAIPAAASAFAWGGALLFVASLALFAYSYAVTFGPGAGVIAAQSAIAAMLFDTALFTVFALHHSIFARERVRAWMARVVPPSLERTTYVWIASALFIGVVLLWQPVPGEAWTLEGGWRWLAILAQVAGVWLSLHGAAVIGVFELSGIRHRPADNSPMEFKTAGPYGWMRHPIYTGWFLVVFGAPTMTMTRLVFAVVSSAYVLVAIPFEERSIRAVSAGAYDAYAEQVRWKLLPGIY